MERKSLKIALVVAALSCAAWGAQAATAYPSAESSLSAFDTGFGVRNEAAVTQGIDLPRIGSAHVLTPGESQLRAQLDWSNEYVFQAGGSETYMADGETQRYVLDLRHGFAGGPWGGFELGVTVPLVVNNGGVMDGIIHNYHELFGFPDGGRGSRAHRQVEYRYTRAGVTGLGMTSSGFNVGDITLDAGVQAKPGLALRTEVKLPSGTANYLTGGNWGGALWLDYDPFVDVISRWYGFMSLGGSWNATSDVLPGLQRHAVLLGGAGLGFHITPAFSLLVQGYAHSPLYKKTAISALRKAGLQGTFGGRYAFSRHLAVEAGFEEDLVTNSSPDFGVHLGLVMR